MTHPLTHDERSGASRALHHRLAAHPSIYDLIQRAAGVSRVYQRVAPWLRFAPGVRVLDVGGGTGTLKQFFGPDVRHVCLDLERPKLARYVAKFADAKPVQGDAISLPVRDGAVDAATLAFVTHHLTDPDLTSVLAELARILDPEGILIVCDAVWAPSRFAGRILWKYDRGSHPRTAAQLASALQRRFAILEQRDFAVFHQYTAFRCRRLPGGVTR